MTMTMSMLTPYRNFGFPFQVTIDGNITAVGGNEAIRSKIIQVLFTTPGERVHQPEFGCGLFDLVFDLNDPILAAAVEFTIGQALTRWLSDEIRVEAANVVNNNETILIEIAYVKRSDMALQAVSISFS